MSVKVDEAAVVLAPNRGGSATNAQRGFRIDGTGTTEQHNAVPMRVGAYATIISDTALWARFAGASALSTQVTAGNAFYIPADVYFSWVVQEHSKHIYVEAKDGSSDWDAFVWQSGEGIY